MSAVSPTVFAAFAAGALSFVSPCVLPLVPGYLSDLTGGESTRPKEEQRTGQILGPAALFCMSFSLVFVLLGLLATGLGAPLKGSRDTLDVVAGVLLMTMGVLYVLTPLIPRLGRTIRPEVLLRRAGGGSPVIAGMAFAVAWTPCAGPILGSILLLAGTKTSVLEGAKLLSAYSLGIAVPFFLTALAVDSFLEFALAVQHLNIYSTYFHVLLLQVLFT